jgi:hypothetical protein
MELVVHLMCPHCGGWEVVEADEHQRQLERSRADPERGPVCPICELVPWTGLVPRPVAEYEQWVGLCEGRIAPPTGPSNQIELLTVFAHTLEAMALLVPLAKPGQLRTFVQALEMAEEALTSSRLSDVPLDHALSVVKGHVDPADWPSDLHLTEAARLEREVARERLAGAAVALRAALDQAGRG